MLREQPGVQPGKADSVEVAEDMPVSRSLMNLVDLMAATVKVSTVCLKAVAYFAHPEILLAFENCMGKNFRWLKISSNYFQIFTGTLCS